MRVIHLLFSNSYSGAEKVVIDIIKGNPKIEFLYVSNDGSIQEWLKEEGITHMLLKKFSVMEISKIVKDFKPDIIHAHDFRASIIVPFVTRNIPIISHLHNNQPWIKTLNLKTCLYLRIAKSFASIFVVSSAIKNEFYHLIESKIPITVVSNPIDKQEIIRKSNLMDWEESYDIVVLGRLSLPKNPLRSLRLFSFYLETNKKGTIAFIGDGELRGEVESFINDQSINDHVRILGFQKNPYPILKRGKVMLMLSNWEGFGLAAIEALSLGVPVICTPVGGLADIVTNDCGMVSDNDKEILDELIKLLADIDYWRKKSAAAEARSLQLDNYRRYNHLISAYYQEILDGMNEH